MVNARGRRRDHVKVSTKWASGPRTAAWDELWRRLIMEAVSVNAKSWDETLGAEKCVELVREREDEE